MKSFFYQQINRDIHPLLLKELGLKTVMQLPKLQKIILSISHRELLRNKRMIDEIKTDLLTITGQFPVITRAKKSVSTFKLRAGMPIGCMVTLRRFRMYEFLYRLIHIVLPRIRDFRGLSLKSFDNFGNYTLGISEEIVFPEIDYNKITINKGMNITFVIKHSNKEHALVLLKKLGLPLRKDKQGK